MRTRFQEYDIPAAEDVNEGDVRTMPNGSKWIVMNVVQHSNGTKQRLTVVPDNPTNRRKVANLIQGRRDAV